ncbi:GNAT family N-acetyltransferase [Bacillus sp. CH30_1T]|uniref:GNAT family N-acetyltransferase n=1 Tax=Bacillus sp. CH30_1T TaxID=2604836 RepID=UPI0011EE1160|nr:GNAT family N-acetyltransferase [Bacillus sp. CH30_1T]
MTRGSTRTSDDYWLFHFFIDKRFQRKGLGSKALQELIRNVKHTNPTCKRLRLTVHRYNEAGKLFYLKVGFQDDRILTFGERFYWLHIRAGFKSSAQELLLNYVTTL